MKFLKKLKRYFEIADLSAEALVNEKAEAGEDHRPEWQRLLQVERDLAQHGYHVSLPRKKSAIRSDSVRFLGLSPRFFSMANLSCVWFTP